MDEDLFDQEERSRHEPQFDFDMDFDCFGEQWDDNAPATDVAGQGQTTVMGNQNGYEPFFLSDEELNALLLAQQDHHESASIDLLNMTTPTIPMAPTAIQPHASAYSPNSATQLFGMHLASTTTLPPSPLSFNASSHNTSRASEQQSALPRGTSLHTEPYKLDWMTNHVGTQALEAGCHGLKLSSPPLLRTTCLENEAARTVKSETPVFQPCPLPQSHLRAHHQHHEGVAYPDVRDNLAITTPSSRMPRTNHIPVAVPHAAAVGAQLRPSLKTIPQRKGVRCIAACANCERDVILNGKNDGTLCTRCFNQENREIENFNYHVRKEPCRPILPLSITQTIRAEDQNACQYHVDTVDQSLRSLPTPYTDHGCSPARPDGVAEDFFGVLFEDHLQPFELSHATVEAARAYLLHPPGEDCQQLDIEGDDWFQVKNVDFWDYSAGLYNVLQSRGRYSLTASIAEDQAYGQRNHDKKFEAVRTKMQSPEDRRYAQARVMCVVDDIIQLHEIGAPKRLLDKVFTKTRRASEPDCMLKCSERVAKIIELARDNKYVAWNILEGKTEDLVIAPSQCVARKEMNLKTNATRSRNNALSKQVLSAGTMLGAAPIDTVQQDDQLLPHGCIGQSESADNRDKDPCALNGMGKGRKRGAGGEDDEGFAAVTKRARFGH